MIRRIIFAGLMAAGAVLAGTYLVDFEREARDAAVYDSFGVFRESSPKNDAPKEKEKSLRDHILGLKEINPDTLGFIEVGEVFLPIVKSHDNQEYLNRDIYGNESVTGCIFVSMLNDGDFSDGNTVIYGHNMKNGSMFGSLKRFLEEEYLLAHKKIKLYGPERINTYEINNVDIALDGSDVYLPNTGSVERKVTLSTCYGGKEDLRLIVQGVLVGIEEN